MQKTVLITGCSEGGIGHALALEFHARGLKVFATARNLQSMEKLKEKGLETIELDVTLSKSIHDVKITVENLTGGSLDILVNNAGVCYETAASDDDMDRIRHLFAVNVFGVMEMTQAFVPLLVASNKRQPLGSPFSRIIQIGSLAAMVPTPFYTAYNSSKAAMLQYGNTLRIELEPFGIKVITINTGRVQTRIIREVDRKSLPEGSLYTPIKYMYEGFGYEVFTIDATPCDEYARKTVSHILTQKAAPFLWAAGESWSSWFFATFFPSTIWDRLLKPMFALDKLGVAVRQGKNTADK